MSENDWTKADLEQHARLLVAEVLDLRAALAERDATIAAVAEWRQDPRNCADNIASDDLRRILAGESTP